MRRSAAACLSVLLVSATAAVAATAVPAAGEGHGWVSEPAPQTLRKAMWGPPAGPDGESMFPTYRDLGVGIYSIQARWDQIAHDARPGDATDPGDPAYQWPQYLTDAIAEAESHGMQVQVLIMGSPSWSNGGRPWKWAPDETSDFADFATAIARRYPSVHLWMIWGEPNRKPNFGPLKPSTSANGKLNAQQRVAPQRYAQLLDAAYEALKAEDPANKVIGGNTYTASGKGDINTYQWIRYMRLPDGSRPRMDMWGHNPWGSTIPKLRSKPSPRGAVTFNDLGRLLKALDRARFPGPRLKLFLAEWGVPTGFRDEDLLYKLKVSEAERWLRAAYRIVRSKPRIYTLGWVHPLDNPRNSMGLLNRHGKPKLIYDVYKSIRG